MWKLAFCLWVFSPINNSPLHGKKTKTQALSKIKKQHKVSIMHPLKVYSTSVTVCKSVDWLLREWSTILGALHQREQFLSPPQSNYHGGHHLLHEDPPHLSMVPAESLISAALHILEQRSSWCLYLFNTGWSSWPARAHVWRHHWIYCIRPLIPRARRGMLNQNGRLYIIQTSWPEYLVVTVGTCLNVYKCMSLRPHKARGNLKHSIWWMTTQD